MTARLSPSLALKDPAAAEQSRAVAAGSLSAAEVLMDAPQVGQIWRPNFGGIAMHVVAIDGRLAHVMRADSAKRSLAAATARGFSGQLIAFSEFADWTLIP